MVASDWLALTNSGTLPKKAGCTAQLTPRCHGALEGILRGECVYICADVPILNTGTEGGMSVKRSRTPTAA